MGNCMCGTSVDIVESCEPRSKEIKNTNEKSLGVIVATYTDSVDYDEDDLLILEKSEKSKSEKSKFNLSLSSEYEDSDIIDKFIKENL